MFLKFISLVGVVFFLFACTNGLETNARPWVHPGEDVDVQQLLKGEFGDERFIFQIALRVRVDKFSMVGMDALGRRAFSLTWTENGILTEKAGWLPDQLNAEYVLNDLMLAYWPIEKIDFAGVEEIGNTRFLKKDERKVARVTRSEQNTRWAGDLIIENYRQKYRLYIKSSVSGGHE